MDASELNRRIAREAAYVISASQTLIISRAFADESRTTEDEKQAKNTLDGLTIFLQECKFETSDLRLLTEN